MVSHHPSTVSVLENVTRIHGVAPDLDKYIGLTQKLQQQHLKLLQLTLSNLNITIYSTTENIV